MTKLTVGDKLRDRNLLGSPGVVTAVAEDGTWFEVRWIPGSSAERHGIHYAERFEHLPKAEVTPAPKCQDKSKTIKHSRPEDDPEMFTVFSKGTPVATSIQCLAHARIAESRGYRVEIILT